MIESRALADYPRLLEQLRLAFPAPVSDPVHDGYVVFTLLRALDQVDKLKSQAPILGEPHEPDFESAALARLGREGRTLEAVLPELVACLQGMMIWGHPRSQVNVTAHPSIASIVGVVLPAMYNPNLCSDDSGRGFSEAEVRVAAMVADLAGYDPAEAGGVFTFGGTGTLLYGAKIGLEKALPGAMQRGVREPVAILCSDQSHYACLNVAGWLGIGQENVIRVPTHADCSIDLAAADAAAREALQAGKKLAAVVGTLGTTDAFGLDDLRGLYELRAGWMRDFDLNYRPHLHADAVIGWAWSAFNAYDFSANPLGFRGRTVRALAAARRRLIDLPLADSFGVDFHKTGATPYVSSLFMLRDRHDFQFLARNREAMPYLYHSGHYHPGMFTLETTRGAGGVVAALANLLLLGRTGLQVLLGHSVEMAETLREIIAGRPELTVVNDANVGPVTLFRAYPEGIDTFSIKQHELGSPEGRAQLLAHNEFNRRIYAAVRADALNGRGVAIGFTDAARRTPWGDPVAALKSYVVSPFVRAEQMQELTECVLAARVAVRPA